MTTIRVSLAVLAFCSLSLLDARPSAAEIYRPWCAQYTGSRSGATNCGFVSYQQCMATAFGAGAYCVQNPWYLAYGSGSGSGRGNGRRW